MQTIKRIKAQQARLIEKLEGQESMELPASHNPEILLIGCVDARLDIIGDLGIPKGKALVYRNIAALIQGMGEPNDLSHMSETAALEFAINVMKVRDIVVMGHTDCGGIRASLTASASEHKAICHYLSSLQSVREEVISKGGDIEAQARAMEEAAVRQSIENLKGYYVVKDALTQQRVTLHGWVINTATGLINEIY